MMERRAVLSVTIGMPRAFIFALTAATLLAACQAEPSGEAEGTPSDAIAETSVPVTDAANVAENVDEADACGAEKLGRWHNATPTDTVKAEIAEAVGHEQIRYIAPGDAVTLDFRPDRLNVETGADGRIKLFRCG